MSLTSPRPSSRLGSLCRCCLWMGLGSLGTWCVFAFVSGGSGATPAASALGRVKHTSPTLLPHRSAPAAAHLCSIHSAVADDLSGGNPNVERLLSLLGYTQNKIRLFLDTAAWSGTASDHDIVSALADLPKCNLEEDLLQEITSVIIAQLAHRDPELAVSLAAAMLDDHTANRQSLEVAYAEWLDQDPAGAFSHALAHLPPGTERASRILGTMLVDIGKTDPELADGFAADMARSGDPIVVAATEFLGKRVSIVWQDRSTAQQALAWIDAQNATPALRLALGLQTLGIAAAGNHPEVTSQLLLSFPQVKDAELRTSLIESLAKTHLPQIRAFVAQNPDEQQRNREFVAMFAAVAPSDRAASLDWLLRELPAHGRDVVLGAAAGVMESKGDGALAFKALSGIQDDKTRTNLTYRYGFNWLGTDPAAARHVVPAEVIQSYDTLTQITASGILNVVPGLRPSINFSP